MNLDSQVRGHFRVRSAGYGGGWVDDVVSMLPIVEWMTESRASSVLDIGCGTGAAARVTASAGVNLKRYVGVDISPEMLKKLPGSALGIVADAHNLPLVARCTQFAICRQAIHYFAEPVTVFKEVRRVLSPGGILVLAQIAPFDTPDDQCWWRKGVMLRQPLRRHSMTVEGMQDVLIEAGFEVVEVSSVVRRSSMESWLNRYPIGNGRRRRVIQHFQGAPETVKLLRNFAGGDGDFEYDIRWSLIQATVSAG